MTAEPADPDDPEEALREVRSRFIASFPGQCDSIAALLGDDADAARLEGAHFIVHRLAGLAGLIGFPSVSERATELESLLTTGGPPDLALARDLLGGIRENYAADLIEPPDWVESAAVAEGLAILIVEDDRDQLALLEIQLQRAGHRTMSVSRGDQAIAAARERRPAIVLVDVELPGLDGHSVCRMMKTDPDLAGIPVVLLSTRASIDARLSGLMLGADDYLCKPFDARELLLRIENLRRRASAAAPATSAVTPGGLLAFDAFAAVATAALAAEPAALALVRAAADRTAQLGVTLADEGRRRDIFGRYDDTHLVWLMPGLDGRAATARARAALELARESGVGDATAGIAAGAAGSKIAALVAQADDALTEARCRRETASLQADRRAAEAPAVAGTLVLADDDPEVTRVVDGYMRAAGFDTVLAFDGATALQAVNERHPDVLVLDLMMPAMSGFDVLMRLQALPNKPRVVVLSAQGREDDVTRAFDLGADDYVVKPFSPQELRARILRLMK